MLLLALLFLMLLLIPLVMAYWFAPVLVVLEDMQAMEAMKLSFTGLLAQRHAFPDLRSRCVPVY